jgi:HD-GYP domain-containing protein (c-di-GMP phosphodiesterase class II)
MDTALASRPPAPAAPAAPADTVSGPGAVTTPLPAGLLPDTGHARAEPVGLRLAELLGALSYALDLTEGQPAGHSVRAAWIGDRIGTALGLDGPARRDLFHAVLLKDLGCSSTAARICQLYVADDLDFKKEMRLVDFDSPAQGLAFLVGQAGARDGGGLAARWHAWKNLAGNLSGIAKELTQTRCHRGADIARMLRFPACVAEGIQALDERWDGKGRPDGLAGDRIPLYARIAHVAQTVEVFAADGGPEAALDMLRRRRGRWFDPAVVDAALALGRDPAFWSGLRSPDLESQVFALAPDGDAQVVDEDYLDDIASAFGQVVDAKSPYTWGHSERVGRVAVTVAHRMGLDAPRARWLRRGAMLHDIGKLGVSNAILDKPGKLDADEWVAMRRHAAYTEEVLGRITAFRVLSRVAGAHHERLDGGGYPRGLDARHIRIETRIITVADVFDALTADRPYRAAMPVGQAMDILQREAGTAFDAECIVALRAALDGGDMGLGG